MFFGLFKKYELTDLPKISLPIGKLREKVKILLIDDEDVPQLEALRRHDFNVTKRDDIEDVKSVCEYDVVLCDIVGVGTKLNKELQGAYLIKEIKNKYPDKYLILYSARQTDMRLNQYFKMCDDVFKKDYDLDIWVEKLDIAVSKSTDPCEKWKKTRDALLPQDISSKVLADLENHYVRKCIGKREKFSNYAQKDELPENARTIILNLASSGIFEAIKWGGAATL